MTDVLNGGFGCQLAAGCTISLNSTTRWRYCYCRGRALSQSGGWCWLCIVAAVMRMSFVHSPSLSSGNLRLTFFQSPPVSNAWEARSDRGLPNLRPINIIPLASHRSCRMDAHCRVRRVEWAGVVYHFECAMDAFMGRPGQGWFLRVVGMSRTSWFSRTSSYARSTPGF